MNLQIATAAEEQSTVSHEIDRSVTNISDITKETALNSQQMMSTADSLSSLAIELNGMVSKFKLG